MTGENSTPTRRSLLSAIGAGLTSGVVGTEATAGATETTTATASRQTASQYVLVQGGDCVPIRPLRGQLSAETFYDYQLPQKYVSTANGASTGETALYSSAGTADLQRPQTSVAFLYQGPEGLSLVVVHGSTDSSDGGAATLRLSGLPKDGEWVVKDDFYRNPDTGDVASSNYDQWQIDGTDHRIDWTWGSGGTDGGVFRGLGGGFPVTIDPKFNDAAALYGKHYKGTVTDWEFLSGSAGVSKRVSLTMDEPIRIEVGSCDRGENGGDGGTDEQASDDDDGGEGENDGANADSGPPYTVCHKPPGNPDNAHTIEVGSESALNAHLEHGDSRGPCSGDG